MRRSRALLAANVPRHTIKRLLRWRGDLSLEIYARLNDVEYARLLESAYSAEISQISDANFAFMADADALESALAAVGSLAEEARAGFIPPLGGTWPHTRASPTPRGPGAGDRPPDS